MDKYNYEKALIKDIKEYITNNTSQWADPKEIDDIHEYWYDILQEEDEVTGNGGGWYAKEEECEEMIAHNIQLAFEACNEFSVDLKEIRDAASNNQAARYLDCAIRCYLLGNCLTQALEELNDEMGRVSKY